MPSSTRLLALGTLLLGLGCGSSDNSVLLTLSALPTRATALAVTATLDAKPLMDSATGDMPLALPLAQNQLGITVPTPGHLALDLRAYDTDGCTQGAASPAVDVVSGVNNLSATFAPVSPRQCGSLTACATGMACTTPSGTTSTIRSIWPIAPNDIWAVGTSATVLHYDGNSWTATPPASLPVPASTRFNGVWASASNDVWAVGAAGQIIRYDGTKWSLSSNGATKELKGISGVSGQSIWTVGLAAGGTTPGEFWHWNGNTWTSITPLAAGDLNTVLAVNPSFVLIGGGDSNANGLLWSFDGTNTYQNYSPSAPFTVTGLWAASPTRAFAVGIIGELLGFDGKTWTEAKSTPTNDFSGVTNDGTYTYVVGAGGYAARSSDPLNHLTPIAGLPGSDLQTIQLAKNGLAWLAGANGFLSYLDTRP